jgi:hypothetical protein
MRRPGENQNKARELGDGTKALGPIDLKIFEYF